MDHEKGRFYPKIFHKSYVKFENTMKRKATK